MKNGTSGINIASIESEKAFQDWLKKAYAVKQNGHILRRESYLYSIAGQAPDIIAEVYQ